MKIRNWFILNFLAVLLLPFWYLFLAIVWGSSNLDGSLNFLIFLLNLYPIFLLFSIIYSIYIWGKNRKNNSVKTENKPEKLNFFSKSLMMILLMIFIAIFIFPIIGNLFHNFYASAKKELYLKSGINYYCGNNKLIKIEENSGGVIFLDKNQNQKRYKYGGIYIGEISSQIFSYSKISRDNWDENYLNLCKNNKGKNILDDYSIKINYE